MIPNDTSLEPHGTTAETTPYCADAERMLLEAELRIEDIERQLVEAKELYDKVALELLQNAPTTKESFAIAHSLYWEHDRSSIRALSQFFNKPQTRVFEVLGGMELELLCNACGNYKIFPIKTKSELADRLRPAHYNLCQDCYSRRKAHQQEASQQRRTEQFERKRIISALRALPYGEYLKTDHWQHVRKAALKRADYRCQLCNAEGKLQVHHRTYENLGNEQPRDLITLCAPCHNKFHKHGGLVK